MPTQSDGSVLAILCVHTWMRIRARLGSSVCRSNVIMLYQVNYCHADSSLAHILFSGHATVPGKRKVANNNSSKPWNETRASRATLQQPAALSRYIKATSLHALYGDVVRTGSHIIFKDPEADNRVRLVVHEFAENSFSCKFGVALVHEILVAQGDKSQVASHICLQPLDFEAELHEKLKVPKLTLSGVERVVSGKVCIEY